MYVIDSIAKISNKLQGLSVNQLAFFNALICEKLTPNYIYFNRIYNLTTEINLNDYLSKLFISATKLTSNSNEELENHIESIENIVPHIEDYEDYSVSFALDCSVSYYYAYKFLRNFDIQNSRDISENSINTIDRFIIFKNNLIPSDLLFEKFISEHELMIYEINFQEQLINAISKLNIIDDTSINLFKNSYKNIIDLSQLK
jgi:uncharacterized protein YjaG (DUF416 family)